MFQTSETINGSVVDVIKNLNYDIKYLQKKKLLNVIEIQNI